jgi:hypothetical protein
MVPVSLKTVLDTSFLSVRFAVGEVISDVKGPDGKVALPAGSTVTIAVRESGKTGARSELNVSIYSVNVLGRQYSFSDGRTEAARLQFTDDAGKGSTHTAVHLQYNCELDFRLDRPVSLP